MSKPEKKPRESILVLNCRLCDDLQRLQEDRPRSCLCGKSAGRLDAHGATRVEGPARVIEIDIEEYDGAGPGEDRKWRIRA